MMLERWTALLLTAALAPLAACGNESRAAGRQEDEAKDRPAREVRLARAEEARLPRTVELAGTLAADEEAELAAKVAGRLSRMAVDLGTPVRRGQVIARLVATDFELRVRQAETALQQARARLGLPPEGPDRLVPPEETAVVRQAAAVLEEARLRRDRMANLFEQQLIPRADLDAAESSLGVADGRHQEAIEEAHTRQAVLEQRRSELEIARRQLADSVVLAPFDGAIRERLVGVGDYVAVGQTVAVLVKTDPLRLRLDLPERESAGVRVGQAVSLSVEGDPGRYAGRVARVAPALREADRTLPIEAEVPNPDGRLRPGSFARAAIVIEPAGAAAPSVLVPASAVVTFAGIDKVIGVEGGKAVEKRVRLGRKQGDRVEILEGVAAGDAVVVAPGNLVSGDPVKVVP